MLSWGQKDYRQFLEYKKDISAIEFSHLAKEFHFSLKAFKENRVDFKAIKNRFLGLSTEPPERYLIGSGSSNLTLINLLAYLEKKFGHELKQALLNHLQISNYIYENPHKKINHLVFEELYSYLRLQVMKDSQFFDMGAYNFQKVLQDNYFGDDLSEYRDLTKFLDYFLSDYLKVIEHNSFYKIKKHEFEKVIIEVIDNPELLELFKRKHLGSYDRCITRAGFIGPLLRAHDLPDAKIRHISCVHRGDEACLYEVDLNKALFFYKNF